MHVCMVSSRCLAAAAGYVRQVTDCPIGTVVMQGTADSFG